MDKRRITTEQHDLLIKTLRDRFTKQRHRHKDIDWSDVQARLAAHPDKYWSLFEMERTGGEPDVVGRTPQTGELLFVDCSPESPASRRSLCYDAAAQESRKENKPIGNVLEMAAAMGVSLLTELQYRDLQQLDGFDLKTSSWIETPENIRKLGGALFGDRRYDQVFVYHNSAPSYYAARGFRASLRV